jgi:pimeloyl-ACP methyl ester carboxylesterase
MVPDPAAHSQVSRGLATYRATNGRRTPLEPGARPRDNNAVIRPDPHNERAPTADGVLLGMRRYPRAGAPPVLLLHGLAQNLAGLDLPVPGHSLARHLHDAGYDVWLGNFRGHGRAPHKSGLGPRAARVDDYGILDAPAFVQRVSRATGRRPFVVGHSMGGIAMYIHLQGCRFDAEHRVVSDPELAAARNEAVAGLVMMGTPPRLRWETRLGLRALLKRQYFEYNELLQHVVGRSAVLHLLDRLPLHALPTRGVAEWVNEAARLPGPGGALPEFANRVVGHLVSEALAHTLWNPRNMNTALVEAETRHTLDDAALPVLRQFVDWIRHETAREHVVDDPRPAYVYADHLHRVTTPTLWVAGEFDRVAPPATIRAHGVARLGAVDKGLLVARGFGHNDLRMGVRAPEALFPVIRRWLDDRRGGATSWMEPWRAPRPVEPVARPGAPVGEETTA